MPDVILESKAIRPAKRLKFSLRTLLFVVTGFCVIQIPLALKMAKERHLRLAIAEIQSLGGTVNRGVGGNRTQILFGPGLTDQQLIGLIPRLDGIPELLWLDIRSPLISGKSISRLASLKRLTSLFLTCPITDTDATSLAKLRSLHALGLSGEQITDDSLPLFATLHQLTYLGLSSPAISDQGIRHLSTLNELEQLDITGTGVTEDGLTTLGGELNFYVLNKSGKGLTKY